MSRMAVAVLGALHAARQEVAAHKLAHVERQVRRAFNEQLGGIDIFGTDRPWSGALLKTVIDPLGGVAVLYHLGGTISLIDASNDRMWYKITGGAGRAFKFLPHHAESPVSMTDFFGPGFPYRSSTLGRVTLMGGTIARVKIQTQVRFDIDAISRVTNNGIEDVRVYFCGGELVDAVQALFQGVISGEPGDWGRFFRLLNT